MQDQFTDEDRMYPVFCISCKQHVPKAVSNANNGLCSTCQGIAYHQSGTTAKPAGSNLFECQECGGQVSRRAAFCPHCGAPFATNIRMVTNIGFQEVRRSLVWAIIAGIYLPLLVYASAGLVVAVILHSCSSGF